MRKNSVALHISISLYLRNHTSYDFHSWYTCVTWQHLQASILIFWVVSGGKKQKIVHNNKNSACCTLYLRNHASYDDHLWYTILKWYLQLFFFQLFIILIFRVVRRVEGQKMVQNDKKLCPLCLYISGTIHHMIFIYSAHG